MPGPPDRIWEVRLAAVRERIATAARAAGRDASEVSLLAVSKKVPDEAVRALRALGQVDFGENLVQAWQGRQERLSDLGIRWHVIGPLQTNKAKAVAEGRPWLLHTVDREEVVLALERRLAGSPPLDVLVQVDVDLEPTKAGVDPGVLDRLADRVAASPALRLRGLMAIPRPRPEGDPRRAFARLRELLCSVAARIDPSGGPAVLSMGMSDDLEDAVLEGSTLVRVGTALFGVRRG